jgi:tetratricopeptide (TPR) repeat protein
MKKTSRFLIVLLVAALAVGATGCTAKARRAYHLSRADSYYKTGQMQSAEIEYLNVLRYDPANTRTYIRLGEMYYDQGRLQRAAFFLGKGSQMEPDNFDVRVKLGFIYSSISQFSNAEAQATFVLNKQPKNDEAPLLLAEAAVYPKAAAAARQRLQSLAGSGDSASIEVALGNLALRQRDTATAFADFKKAAALDPKSPAVNVALATEAWSEGDLSRADAYFKAAADASPVRSPRRMQFIRFKMETGDLAGARAVLDDLLKAAPDYLPATLILAEVAADQKKFDECADLLNQALKMDPDNFDALFFQSQLELARGQPAQAVTDMDRMAHMYPQVAPVQYHLGTACLATHDLTKAAESFERALQLNPNYVEAQLALAETQIQTGNADPAIASLERLRQQQPKLVQAQLLLADAYRLRNRNDEALAIYNTLESADPTNAQVAILHGAALLHIKDNAAARQEFEKVLRLVPGQVSAVGELVDLDIADQRLDAATRFIQDQIRQYPQQVAFRILAAKIQLAGKQRDQAEKTLLDTLTFSPTNTGVNLLLAQIYSDAGQNQKARDKVNAVMALDPQNIPALMLAATIYGANNDNQGAADAYEKVLKIDPKYSPALNNLAYIYTEEIPNLDRAYDLAQQAREMLPFDPSTADTYGWVCFKRGAYQPALDALKSAAAKMPNQSEVQFHLGMVCYMTGDESNARTALQQAWQSGKDFPNRAECGLCLTILNIDPSKADPTALATLEKRVAEKPNDPVAQHRLARIYQRTGNTDKAIAAYETIVQAAPQDLDAQMNLINLYTPKDPQKAYSMAKTAVKIAPYDPEVCHTLGRLAFAQGDYHLAASMLQQAVQNQPNNASLLLDYSFAAYSLGKVADAQSALQNSLALNLPASQAAQARQMLDMISLANAPAQAAAASARITDILKAAPDDVPALMARAAAAESTGDLSTAAADCEKVLLHYPDFTPAQSELARIYTAQSAKLDRALSLAMQAHDALPDDPAVAKTLGIIYFKRGDFTHAVLPLEQSAMKSGSDPETFYYLGAAQFNLKNRAESKANLQQAVALKLPDTLGASAKQMLAQLK